MATKLRALPRQYRQLSFCVAILLFLLLCGAFLWTSYTEETPEKSSEKTSATYKVITEIGVKVSMRDGIRLSSNIFRPGAPGKFPVLLTRTPYGKGTEKNPAAVSQAQRGYVVVIQDTRGRFDSEGTFDAFRHESEDGYDTQQWIGAQPWCDGKIGTQGGSYVGFTQWAPAPLGSPYLKAMFPVVTFSDLHDDISYIGGAFQLSLTTQWSSFISTPLGGNKEVTDWAKALRQLPLARWDEEVLGRRVAFLRDWISHPDYDGYWQRASILEKYSMITVPVYNVGGWYDIFSAATAQNFSQMTTHAKTSEAKKSQKLLMGPWGHGISKDGKVGDRNFGSDSVVDLGPIQQRWFDYWLKGINNSIMDEPPVRIFVMGENAWRNENEWPLARTRYTKYYLHSKGSANTADGDGILNTSPPANEPPDRYIYDPDNPVPTMGGNNLFPPLTPIGPYDQRQDEKRTDVLVFTSDVLGEDVEVTGPVQMKLYAASSAADTDFTAKLVDVYPDGYAQNIVDGIIRARYRESKSQPSLIEPGKIYEYTIDLWVTSNLFKKGHRIRLEISSSNFPRFDRNPNTGHPFGQDSEIAKAEQTIYYDAERPSHIILPIIPR